MSTRVQFDKKKLRSHKLNSAAKKRWYLDYSLIPGFIFLLFRTQRKKGYDSPSRIPIIGVHFVQYTAKSYEKFKGLCTWSLSFKKNCNFVIELRHSNNNNSNENVIIRYFGIIFCFSFAINTKDTDVIVSVFKDHVEQSSQRKGNMTSFKKDKISKGKYWKRYSR